MFLGVGTDQLLYTRASISHWTQVPSSGAVLAATVLPDGTLLGVGTDHLLYTRATLTSAWSQVANSGSVIGVTVLPDGTIVGIGLDNTLYTRATLITAWSPVAGSGSVKAVTTMPDGSLLGVGIDNVLYTRATLTSAWSQVPGSGSVIGVTVLVDGTIVGVGTDNTLYTRATLTSAWSQVANSGSVIGVTVLPDGTIVGIGLDNTLYLLPALTSAWSQVPGSGSVIGVTVLPDGTIVGVGTDNTLYTRANLASAWSQVAGSGKLKAITAMPDGTLLGVGLDNFLYWIPIMTGTWTQIPNSGAVIGVAVLPSGTIVGVGTDNTLYIRTTMFGTWSQVPDSGSVKAITALPDGTLVGIGLDNNLYTRVALTSPWVYVPNSAAVIGVTALPDASVPPSAATWLLQFSSPIPAALNGDGRPWGDGTAMAARAASNQLPWDNGCLVTPLLGGFATMNAIRDALEAAIADANAQAARGVAVGQRGHVYITDWLLNGLRDLSETNAWGGQPWNPAATVARDQTALGLLVRMMAAGISVRVLLWMPTTAQRTQLKNHADEQWSVAAAIQDYNDTLQKQWGLSQPIGVVALDLRVATPVTASLHQKMVVVRVGNVNVGFCGGVDLAFTRRDFGRAANQVTGIGDWQSGDTAPLPSAGWPKQSPAPVGGYPAFPYLDDGRFPEDLPANVYGSGNRYWHDHHLKLEGPIVATLEQQFGERWIIDTSGRVYPFVRTSTIGYDNQVQLTSQQAFTSGRVLPLPAAQPCPPAGTAAVQMWRTIPLRSSGDRKVAPFMRGEFTIMAGVANAVSRASSLITIWDQYFWSVPLANLLAARLRANQSLFLLIVLPPFGTTNPANELRLRKNAMQALWNGLDDSGQHRVLALNTWLPRPLPGVGIYVHAKVQTYDDALLVCGSANMNRRSFECDAELDCAVMHRPTLRRHLANLYFCVTGKPWTDFADGWPTRYWAGVRDNRDAVLITDPFFTATIGNPKTPNGIPIPYDGSMPDVLFEPTSIGPAVDTGVCQFPDSPDPKAPGRLDEVTFLLEGCYQGSNWPWRVANTSALVDGVTIQQIQNLLQAMPPLTL